MSEAKRQRRCDYVIWTPAGVWLQTVSEGTLRLSGMGRMSLEVVEPFCGEHGLELVVLLHDSPGRGTKRDQVGTRRDSSRQSCPARAEG